MAKQVEEIIVGIDTAQQWLDLYRADTQASERIDNTVEAVKAWLKGFSTPLAIAIEATNCYHEVLVEAAIAAGHVVYLIDPRKLHHYREATGGRAKTDRQDAILRARYLQRERSELRPFQPASPQQQRFVASTQTPSCPRASTYATRPKPRRCTDDTQALRRRAAATDE